MKPGKKLTLKDAKALQGKATVFCFSKGLPGVIWVFHKDGTREYLPTHGAEWVRDEDGEASYQDLTDYVKWGCGVKDTFSRILLEVWE